MKSSKREAGGEMGVILASDLVLAVNPRVTFRWSSRSADADNRSRLTGGTADESVGLSTLRTEERTLLALADGRRSIDDLARLAGMPILVAMRVLRSLYDRGILVAADKMGDPDRGVDAGVNGRPTEPAPPRILTEVLTSSGPVEYDYSGAAEDRASVIVAEEAALPDQGDTSQTVVAAPGGTVVMEAPEMSSSGRRAGVPAWADDRSSEAAASLPAGSGSSSAQPASLPFGFASSSPGSLQPGSSSSKKAPSGPNVTLFWIPTSPDSATPSPVSQGDASAGEAAAPAPPRKNTPEATVVVRGSPSAPTSGNAPAERVAAIGSAPLTAANPPGSAIPFRVGAYEVATRIAQGAMGSIYVCRRVGAGGFQRLFTLKVIRQHSTQKDLAIRSFTREARIGALLNHPNVQTLVDVGNYEDQPFLILDYVEGTSLADLLGDDDRKPPAPIVISIILDLLRGLQHVHDVVDGQGMRLGLVHGDVSPQNILVGVDGAARLTDFGSARFAKEERTPDGEVAVGKPAYMAPEQLRGDPTDARTDLFSVGIVLWTALTGQKLFAAETYDQTVMRIMRRKIPPPSEHGAPASFDSIVLKALSRAPEGRYVTADEMSRDILKVASAENLLASPRDVEQWVRRELGDALADRRRKIQEMFGGTGASPDGISAPRPPRPHRVTPRTADGFERLPARTVQIGAAGLGWSAPTRSMRRPNSPPRSQWVVVIGSAVVAACALAVAVAYFVSSMMTPQKRPPRRMPAPAGQVSAAGAPPAAAQPRDEAVAKTPEKTPEMPEKTADPGEIRSDTPQSR